MKRILFVVLAGVLMVPGAWAYSPGEQAGVEAGGIAEAGGINACPVAGNPVPHSGLQRMAMDPGALSTAKYPMSPVASCGTPPDRLAQIPMSRICRNGPNWCVWNLPRPIGEACCCYTPQGVVMFCGLVSY